MILIPIGHDELFVRRLPWATLAIALVCIAVQVRASYIESTAEVARVELRGIIERIVRAGLEKRAAEGKQKRAPVRNFRFDPALAVSMLGEDVQEEVARYRKQLAELEQQQPASRLGYRAGEDGLDRMVTSAFAHGGWLHLLANLLVLYLVGCNLEARWGWWRFLGLYLAGVAVAGFSFALWQESGTLVGASGAIAAAMGAFVVVFWRAKIRFAYWFGVRAGSFALPAWCALLFWLGQEAWLSATEPSADLRVAYSAHVGGFVFGLAVALVARGIEWWRDRRAGLPFAGPRVLPRVLAPAGPVAQRVGVALGERASGERLLVEARKLAGEGKARDALAALDGYLASNPGDVTARELALTCAEAAKDDAAMGRHASAIFERWIQKGELARVAEMFRFLHEERPGAVLEARALVHVLAVGRTLADNELLLAAASDYVEHYADGKEMPRILWLAAEAQESQGRGDLALRTLRSLVSRFPSDPLAKLARRKLDPAAQ